MSFRDALKHGINSVIHPLGLHLSSKQTFGHLMELHRHWEQAGANGASASQLSPHENFLAVETLRLTKRRQEHLESLGLDLAGRSVLEVGAGIGDHTTYFLDRGCKVLSTDARAENLRAFRQRYERYPHYANHDKLEIDELDLDRLPKDWEGRFEVVYCYGVLYHLQDPLAALQFLARRCTELLLVETSVCLDAGDAVQKGTEDSRIVSQSVHGQGCHPSRLWMWRRLREQFEHVYVPMTQPWHEQFPLDWVEPVPTPEVAQRAIFIGSRRPLDIPLLLDSLPDKQIRGMSACSSQPEKLLHLPGEPAGVEARIRLCH